MDSVTIRQREECVLKTLTCADGVVISGESDDELVSKVEAHLREAHPELAGRVSYEQIIAMAVAEPTK